LYPSSIRESFVGRYKLGLNTYTLFSVYITTDQFGYKYL